MKKRFLITTANEETWKLDSPILFLGEWCRVYKRREIWGNLDASIVPYHWDDREQYYNDYFYIDEVYERILIKLCSSLNIYHETNHSVRYWRIVLGPWLSKFINTLYDRWVMVHKAVNEYSIDSTIILKQSIFDVIPSNMKDYISIMWDDNWNNFIIGEIIKKSTDIEWEEKQSVQIANDCNNLKSKKDKIGFKMRLLHVISKFLGKIKGSDDIFIINSYLPIFQEFLFYMYLKKFPKIWLTPEIKKFTPNADRRSTFSIKDNGKDKFIIFLNEMVSMLIPTVYLEGYKEVVDQTFNLPWPSKPKFIFTSNAYEHDDVFKIWAAEKIELGVPLVIGQHGGFFGVSKWNTGEEHQVKIADRFITWGWNEPSKTIYPGIALSHVNKKYNKWKRDGDLLFVTVPISRYSWKSCSWPVAANQSNQFVNNQLKFARLLQKTVRDRLMVRLLVNFDKQQKTSYKEKWMDSLPEVSIDPSIESISSVVSRCRLFISGYNATTFLYSLSMNIPTIMFWDPSFMELRPSAMKYFGRLKSVGIFHDTPESAASKINEIWDDVENWWNQKEIQEAKREFCEEFSYMPDKPFHVLKEALNIK